MEEKKRPFRHVLAVAMCVLLACEPIGPALAETLDLQADVEGIEIVGDDQTQEPQQPEETESIEEDTTGQPDGDDVAELDESDSAVSVVAESTSSKDYTAYLTFSDTGITETAAGSGYSIDGTTLTISASGTYRIGGTCSEGAIEVKKEVSGVVLELDGLNLASSTTAPIVVKKSASATIHLVDGTTNTLTNNEDPANETSADAAVADAFEGACIKVKSGGSLTFCGGGNLTCVANTKNGIKGGATSSLTFNQSGTVSVTGGYSGGATTAGAANNGIAADGTVTINQGTFVIAAANDGIKAAPDADDADSTGSVFINGGTFDIDADGDGIQAETLLRITAGTFDIKTYKGYSTWNDSLANTMSCKGLKASGDREGIENAIEITGGTFVLNCADDAVHSDASVTVTGGSFAIQTGDDGMHADTSLVLGKSGGLARDPDVTVGSSYEGLEGSEVYIYSGRYHVVASDDGINAAGGSSNGTDPWHGGGQDPFRPGPHGPRGMGAQEEGSTEEASAAAQAASNYNIYISGGEVYVNCAGDGLDSNGGLYLTGGTQVVFSQAPNGDNSALDADGTVSINGATVFTSGITGVDGTARASWFGNGQKYATSSSTHAANTVVNATVGGNVVFSAKLPKQTRYTMFSAPGLSATPTLATASGTTSCKGGSWSHSWNDGVTADGITTYTCTVCGATEQRTEATAAAVDVCDHSVEPSEGEGFAVTFALGRGASVNVYHTQDYSTPSETGVTSTLSRDSDTGEPDNTGGGQVNFSVVLKDGYTLAGVTATEGTYKNIKDVSADAGIDNTYRVTKVSANTTVTITTTADISAAEVAEIPRQAITGGALTPKPVVTLCGETLVEGKDYTLGYANNTGVGTATVTITGTGTFTGSLEAMFQIVFPDVTDTTPHADDIYWLATNGITTGYPNGTYRPMLAVARQDMAAFLFRLAKLWGVVDDDWQPTKEQQDAFSDVNADTPHYREVLWLAATGISTGYADGTFRPTLSVTRQDMAAFLFRLAKLAGKGSASDDWQPTSEQLAAFSDVTTDTPHYREVAWLAAEGVSTGYADGTFRPRLSVVRQDMAAFLHRLDALE